MPHMDSNKLDENAESSTAQTGDVDGPPSHQTDQAKPPAKSEESDTGTLFSEDAKAEMLAKFKGDKPEDAGGDAEGDKEADPSGEEDQDKELSDDDMDEIGKSISDEKRNKAFAKMRREAKERRAELEEIKPLADYGKKVQGILEQYGADEEALTAALQSVRLSKEDPLRAMKQLRAQLEQVANAAREEFGDEVVDSLMKSAVKPAAKAEKTWQDEFPEIAESVEMGVMEEGRALQIVEALRREAPAEKEQPEPKGGQDEPDQEAATFAPDGAWYEKTHAMLLDVGAFEGLKSDSEVNALLNDTLFPKAGEIIERYGLNPADPNVVYQAIEDAARAHVESRSRSAAKKSRQPLSGRDAAARSRDGGSKESADWKGDILAKGNFRG